MHFRLALIGLALACCVNACSSTGGGSSMPGGQLPNSLPIPTTPTAAPTPTPNIATGNIIVTGDGNAQTLQAPGDFKVSAVFPKSTASPVTLSVTVSVPGPGGIDAYGSSGKPKNGLFGKSHKGVSPAVLYVWFESDKGATLASLPTLDFSIPISVLDQYGTDPIIGLAIYDPASEGKWTEGIAERGNPTPSPSPSGGASSTPSATPTPTLTPTPTPTATPVRPPGAPVGPLPSPTITPAQNGIATARPPVPSMTVRFTPTQRTMKLLAKKNFVFVLYAEPAPSPTPSPAGSGKPAASATASPSAAATAAASGSPAAQPSSSTSAAPAPSASPTST